MRAKVLPGNILNCMSPEDRAKLGRAGMTPEEAMLASEARDEAELQKWCGQLLTHRGIEFINPPMHKRSQLPKGWPDFTFSLHGRSCAWECKTETGKLDPDQVECITKLRAEPNCWRVAVIRSAAEAKAFLDAKPSRAAFQEWFEADAMPLEHSNWFRVDGDGFYEIDGVESAWNGWKAALQSSK